MSAVVCLRRRWRRFVCRVQGHDMEAREFEYVRPSGPPATLRVCSKCSMREITLWPAEIR